jgi:hypothetical protein
VPARIKRCARRVMARGITRTLSFPWFPRRIGIAAGITA